MSLRKKTIVDYVKKGMMPALASASQLMQMSTASIALNLTGTRESVYNVLGESSRVRCFRRCLGLLLKLPTGRANSLERKELALQWFQMTAGTVRLTRF